MHPVRVSENGRYLVDQEGAPAFWLGTTQWQLFRDYSLEEAELIIGRTAAIGFAFVQVMLMGVGDGRKPNIHGHVPWIDNDPLAPNEDYFRNVDAIVEIARSKNVAISMTVFHQRYRECVTLDKARAWARWVSQRYADVPTIVWSMTPEDAAEFIPLLRELAAGLREGDSGRHLITIKPDPAPPFTCSFAHEEEWVDFTGIQTWSRVDGIYPTITHEYGLSPAKPVLMAEGAYEQGSEYGFDVTPLWIRRQAYYSYLAGAHHTYGHNDSWRVLPTWRAALDAPGAAQLGLLKRVFLEREEWWHLVPDQAVLAAGGETQGRVLNLAARHKDGRWAMVYCGGPTSLSVNTSKLAGGSANAFWIDPRTAEPLALGSVSGTETASFSTPDGWEDALLILEATR
jgi:hypothetical protein